MTAKIYNIVTNEVTIYENVVSVESISSDKNKIILTLPDNKFKLIDISGKKQFIIS
jgi:tricorn protease-like protein